MDALMFAYALDVAEFLYAVLTDFWQRADPWVIALMVWLTVGPIAVVALDSMADALRD